MGEVIPIHLTVDEAAEYLEVSARRVRALLARGELQGSRAEGGAWMTTDAAVVGWRNAHPRAGRRLTNEAQWALISELNVRPNDWMSPLLRHRTRRRVREWTPEQISDAVAMRGPMPEVLNQIRLLPHLTGFENAESPDPISRYVGLLWIADSKKLWEQNICWEWWAAHGVTYDDFWAAPAIPEDGEGGLPYGA